MSETFRCDDKEMLVAYLYGEIDANGGREVERHLRTCSTCARETEGLQSVRHDLEAWLAPDADLGFTIPSKAPATVLQPARWAAAGGLPAWAQVAAAALFIAASAAIANVQVRSTTDGFVVSTGWIPVATPVSAGPVAPASNNEWRRELSALEQTLRRELTPRAIAPAPVPARSHEAGDTAAVLRRVQTLLAESEQRQRQELALRLATADRDWSIRRQTDLMNINQTLGRLQRGALRTEAGQQEMVNLIRRVSTPIP
ncbi:MAG: zf-HC2 domain-containing protein [Acidobacteria bacterium]|nr:zf-HC2 domain-containing protein [Acidobacteriota bacterium]